MVPTLDNLSTEILCLILQRLPPADIVVCRRVCKLFNDIINTSLAVKYAFYPPSTSIPIHDTVASADILTSSKSYNFSPLLEANCPRFFKTPSNGSINATLWKRWDCLEKHRAAFVREGASWATMTLTQPPVTRLDIVHVWYGIGMNPRCRHGYVNIPTGVPMKVLYAYVCRHLARRQTTFLIDWNDKVKKNGLSTLLHVSPFYPLMHEKETQISLRGSQVVLICVGVKQCIKTDLHGQEWLAKWTPAGESALKGLRITGGDGKDMTAIQFMDLKRR